MHRPWYFPWLLMLVPSIAYAQAIELEVAGEVVEAANGDVVILTDDGRVIEADNEVGLADVAIEAVVEIQAEPAAEDEEKVQFEEDGKGAIGEALGGFFRAIAGGPARNLVPAKPAPDDAFSRNVAEIDSLAELRKLEQQLNRDNNTRQIHPRVKQQVENARNVELEFLHLACDLTRSEFKAIQKAIEIDSLRLIVKHCQLYGRQFRPGRNRQPKAVDLTPPQKAISQAIVKQAKVLGKKRLAFYQEELNNRDSFRKEAVVGTLVTGLDTMLHLDLQQREKMAHLLTEKWQDAWTMQYQYFGNIEYIAGMPRNDIKKLLTSEQKEIFDSITWQPQGIQQFFWNNQIDMFGFARRKAGNMERRLKFAAEEKAK